MIPSNYETNIAISVHLLTALQGKAVCAVCLRKHPCMHSGDDFNPKADNAS